MLYWNWREVPEVAGLSEPEKMRLWRKCYPRIYRHWQTWAAEVVCLAIALTCLCYGQILLHPFGHRVSLLGGTLFGCFGAAIGVPITTLVWIAMIRPYFRREREAAEQER
jgi:hypothetical protein